MAKSVKTNPRERIIQAVSVLFYEKGYNNTGIDDIVAASGAHKASIYKHFGGKEDLVRAYLKERECILGGFLEDLAKRSGSPTHFFKLWQKSFSRAAASGKLFGCPLVNINAELGDERSEYATDILAAGETWQNIVLDFLRREQRAGRIKKKVGLKTAGRRIMAAYQGHLQLYNLSRDARVLDTMAADMLAALQ